MRVLDCFSGIGAFSLGLERAGMRTVQFVEINTYCRAVLKRHWPDVPCHGDIRTFHAGVGIAELVCGGFPCQELSIANSRNAVGMAGPHSGLWAHFRRVVGEVRPRYAVVENVPALLVRGLGVVLGDLAALGYDAEWHCIPAASVGAPHRRDRLWIVAYPSRDPVWNQSWWRDGASGADPSQSRHHGAAEPVADTNSAGLERRQRAALRECAGKRTVGSGNPPWTPADWWGTEPGVGRVVDGTAHRVDRIRALGNSLVPQIAEMIGRYIMETNGGLSHACT